jgi:basic membrane protein A
MLKRVETSLVYALKAVQNKTFRGEVIVFDLQADGVGYSDTNSALTAAIKSELEQIKQRIISGQIKVADTYADAKKLPGFPQDLKAMDN